ncbi:MAG: hypothetical protein K0U12_00810, partial [Gammaproteobacteria bacterium]|nr:hypothetical protein [Gammaproteobacteria bacterium]
NKNVPNQLTSDRSEGAKSSDSFLVVMARREKCFASWLITDMEKGEEASLTKRYFADYPDQLIRIASKHRFFAEWLQDKLPVNFFNGDLFTEDCRHDPKDSCGGGWKCVLDRTAVAETKPLDTKQLIANGLSSPNEPICAAAQTLIDQGVGAEDENFVRYLMQNYTAHQKESLLVTLASDCKKFNNYIAKIPFRFFIEWLFELHIKNSESALWEGLVIDDIVHFTAHQVNHFQRVSELLIEDLLRHGEHALLLRGVRKKWSVAYLVLVARDQKFAKFSYLDSRATSVRKMILDNSHSGATMVGAAAFAHPDFNKWLLKQRLLPSQPYPHSSLNTPIEQRVSAANAWTLKVCETHLGVFAAYSTLYDQRHVASRLECFGIFATGPAASASASEPAASISMDCS